MRALHRLLLPVITSGALAACTVEPHQFPGTSGADGGADAGPTLGAPCVEGGAPCPSGMFCSPAFGRCEVIPTTCQVTSDCAPDDVCRSSRCQRPILACSAEADCTALNPSLTCLAIHRCGPRFSEDGLLLTRCSNDQDCGPASRCKGGVCAGCATNADCPGALFCTNGQCTQPSECFSDQQCFAGSLCVLGVCARSTAGCTPDPANDSPTGATAIRDGLYAGSICGADTDYYKVSVPARSGALIVVTTTAALPAGLGVHATATTGLSLAAYSESTFPHLAIAEVSAATAARALLVRVSSGDISASYGLDVRFIPNFCAGDLFDIYGDTSVQTAPVVRPGTTSLRSCPSDVDVRRLAVSTDDRVSIVVSNGAHVGTAVAIFDARGATVAAGLPARAGSSTITVTSPRFPGTELAAVEIQSRTASVAGGTYKLALDVLPGSRYQACLSPPAIALTGSGVRSGSASGTLAGGADLGNAACSDWPARRNDALLRVPLGHQQGVLTASVRQTNTATTSTVTVALLGSCDSGSATLTCAVSRHPLDPATFEYPVTATAAVYLLVSSSGAAEDVQYAVDVTFQPAPTPSNDVCTAAELITRTATLSASTFFAASGTQIGAGAMCGAVQVQAAGPERFWLLPLASGERAALELDGPPGGILWVADDCATLVETCTTAASIRYGAPARVSLAPTGAANYLVVVQGTAGSNAADYTLRAVLGADLQCLADSGCPVGARCVGFRCVSPPAPSNQCNGQVIGLSAGHGTIVGSTGPALDAFASTCGGSGSPDEVYQVQVPPGTRLLRARISRATWSPLLAIRRTTCSSVNAEVACEQAGGTGSSFLPEARVLNPAAGTYYIIVDGTGGAGPFTLDVDLFSGP